jgi:hypothetical protein
MLATSTLGCCGGFTSYTESLISRSAIVQNAIQRTLACAGAAAVDDDTHGLKKVASILHSSDFAGSLFRKETQAIKGRGLSSA